MAKHLILPIGNNPLPVYVAGRILTGTPHNFETVSILHSGKAWGQGSRREAVAVWRLLKDHAGLPEEKLHMHEISEPGNPAKVTSMVNEVVKALHAKNSEASTIHVHYSGGTKTMAVFSWSALKDSCPKGWTCEASYLDPRSGTEGTGSGSVLWSDRGTELHVDGQRDPRRALSFSSGLERLETLSTLHGFEKWPFCRRNHVLSKTETFQAPDSTSATIVPLSRALSTWICADAPNRLGPFVYWRYKCWKRNTGKYLDAKAPESFPGTVSIPLKTPARDRSPSAGLDNGSLETMKKIANVDVDETQLTVRSLETLALLNAVLGLSGKNWMEDWTFEALGKAVGQRTPEGTASGCFVGRNATFAALNDGKPFELDVVGVLGYQLLAVSCTTTDNEAEVKAKGFEVLHRARQVGGDEARGIVLCGANEGNADRIQRDLHDTIGVTGSPLRIWGVDRYGNLTAHLAKYLKDEMSW